MQIRTVSAYRVRIPFRATFSHALQSRSLTDTIVLVIESDVGDIGIGEVLPRPYVTGETVESVLEKEIPALARRWFQHTFEDRDEVIETLRQEAKIAGRALATLAGWELAVLDMAGKAFHFPAGDVLGPAIGPELEGGAVVDFSVPTQLLEKHCMLLRLADRRYIKVKVGLDDDLRRLEIVRGTLGADQALRLDANGAWSSDFAIRMLRQMRRFNIHSIEQPVPARDLDGMRRVREKTGVAVVADESLCSVEDAHCLVGAHAADIFNIRIGKCGGLLASQKLVRLAHEARLRCQLGTLVGETGILSQAAEIFSRRVKGFDFLEGKHQNKLFLVQDIVEVPPPGYSTAREGLGLTLASNHLAQQTSAPTVFSSSLQRSIA